MQRLILSIRLYNYFIKLHYIVILVQPYLFIYLHFALDIINY